MIDETYGNLPPVQDERGLLDTLCAKAEGEAADG
jgi:hypothetical protein